MSVGKRRQGKAQASGQWCRSDLRLALYLRDRFACLYCGRDLSDAAPADITLDHLLPRSAGGSNEATNLVTACRSCNSARGAKPWLDYATGGAHDRIEQQRHRPLNRKLAKAILAGEIDRLTADVEAAR